MLLITRKIYRLNDFYLSRVLCLFVIIEFVLTEFVITENDCVFYIYNLTSNWLNKFSLAIYISNNQSWNFAAWDFKKLFSNLLKYQRHQSNNCCVDCQKLDKVDIFFCISVCFSLIAIYNQQNKNQDNAEKTWGLFDLDSCNKKIVWIIHNSIKNSWKSWYRQTRL